MGVFFLTPHDGDLKCHDLVLRQVQDEVCLRNFQRLPPPSLPLTGGRGQSSSCLDLTPNAIRSSPCQAWKRPEGTNRSSGAI